MNAMRIALCSLLLLIATAPLMAQGTYTQIDYPGATTTQVYGIDTAGDVVGFYTDSSAYHGFLLSGGVYTTIDYPGATYTFLYGINDVGQVVGVAYPTTSTTVGFRYDIVTKTFTTIRVPRKNVHTFPLAINNAGAIVGFFTQGKAGSIQYGFEAIGTTYRKIEPPTAPFSYVDGISSSGEVAGYVQTTLGTLNFVFVQGEYRPVMIPTNSFLNAVYGINPAGTALVGFYEPDSQQNSFGFLYQGGILTTLQSPGATYQYASGINADGEVVGSFLDSSYVYHGFAWTPSADARKP